MDGKASPRWWLRLGGLAALVALLACAATPEWEPIAPSEFHFVPVVGPKEPGPGGWKAARLLITLARQEGQIFKPQQSAATASDQAAERVLRQSLLSAEMCKRYHLEMEKLLREFIPGARVKDFADYPKGPPLP